MTFSLDNGLQLLLHENNLTASIIGSSNDCPRKVIVPSSFRYQNNTYIITDIASFSFFDNEIIDSLIFTEDSKLQTIKKYAFYKASIRKLVLPESLKEIEDGWIQNALYLEKVVISPNNQYFQYVNSSLLVHKETSTIIFAKKDIRNITIPAYITRMGKCSFANCVNLKSLTFEDHSQLKSIGRGAFRKSTINRIYIPQNVEILENGWCEDADMLEFVKISPLNEHIKYVNKYLLVSKNENGENVIVFVKKNAESMIIPSYINIIGESSFSCCKFVKTIQFAPFSQLKRISYGAFQYSGLEILEIPESVEKLDDGWCCWAKSIYDIKLSPKNSNFQIYDNKLLIGKGYKLDDGDENDIEPDKFTTIVFGWKDFDEIVIPNYIKRIGAFAFESCRILRKVSFEENSQLRSIGNGAFLKAPLQTLFIPASCENLNRGWCRSNKILTELTIDSNNQTYEYVDNTYLFSDSRTTLLFARRDIAEARIPASVKRIGYKAFDHCKYLKSINFECDIDGSKLSIISAMAFSDCLNLSEILLLNTIRKIGSCAFLRCKNLKTVHFQSYDQAMLDEISESLFESCYILKSIKIPNSIKRLGSKSFYDCPNLRKIEFHENSKLKQISDYCFSYTKLQELNLPTTIKFLENGFCGDMHDLKSINFEPNPHYFSYFDNLLIDKIRNVLLYASKHVETVKMPKNIQVIGSYAFSDCKNLKSITFEDNSEISTICKGAFSNSGLISLEIPKTVDSLEDGWCKDTLYLTNLNVSLSNIHYFIFDDKLLVGEYNQCWYETEDDEPVGFVLVFAPRDIEKAAIPYNIRHIGYAAFEACRKLRSVLFLRDDEKLPMVRTFRYSAFSMCNMLSFATIPNNLEVVGRSAFYKCNNIQFLIYLSDNPVLQEIRDFSFSFCANLQSVTIPASVQIINRNAFYDCRNLFAFTIEPHSKLAYIGKRAFSYSKLSFIKLPLSIEFLDEHWMEDTNELLEVDIPIENKFYKFVDGCLISQTIGRKKGGCIAYVAKNIENVIIPNSVWNIYCYAFAYCKFLKSITWESNGDKPLLVHKIPNRAFYSCTNLKSISIPSSIYKIDQYSFFYCRLLESITFILDSNNKSALKEISNSAFYCCVNLNKVEFPSSLRRIGDSSFENCVQLSEAIFPKSSELAIINVGAFGGDDIRNFTIPSKVIQLEEGWNRGIRNFDSIMIEPGNSRFFYLNRNFLIHSTNIENILLYVIDEDENIIIPSSVNRIGRSAFANCIQCKTISFEDNSKLKSIGADAFKDSTVETLHLPSSLERINDAFGAYASCLTNIVLSPHNPHFKYIDNKFLLGKYEYDNKPDFNVLFFAQKKIVTARIPSIIKRIGKHAFSRCKFLKKLKFSPDSVLEEIDDYAFSYCSNLELVDPFPSSIKRIGSSCFAQDKNLLSIEFSCENAKISSYGFIDCSNLTVISLQNQSTIIFDEDSLLRAPDKCIVLMSVNSEQMGMRAFIKRE